LHWTVKIVPAAGHFSRRKAWLIAFFLARPLFEGLGDVNEDAAVFDFHGKAGDFDAVVVGADTGIVVEAPAVPGANQ